MHKLMRDELCALMIMILRMMMMISKNDGSSLLHQCHIVSLHKKAKQSFILSRPFLFRFFAIPLFIPMEIASWIASHNQFKFICFAVDLWISWMFNKKSCWQIYYFFPFYSNYLTQILVQKGKRNIYEKSYLCLNSNNTFCK